MARISGVTIRFLAMMNVELLCRKTIINYKSNNDNNHHNYNKIIKSEWLSTALISALMDNLIGQYAPSLFSTASKNIEISFVLIYKKL